jgi:hypothetical protein
MKTSLLTLFVACALTLLAQTDKPSAKSAGKTAAPATQSSAPRASKPASTTTRAVPGQKVEDMMDSFQMMEKGFWNAWKNKDAKPFEQHMAPNSLIIDNTGITDKESAVKSITGCEVKNFNLSDFKLTKIDNDNALLTYKAQNIDAVCAGQKAPANVFASTVFSKSGGKWWMLFHQESAAIPNQPAQ